MSEQSLENAQKQSEIIQRQMGFLTDCMMNTLERTSRLAEKGPVNVLLSVGVTLIVLGLVFKVEILGQSISNIGIGEFVTIILCGVLMIFLAAFIRVYQYHMNVTSVVKEQQRVGAEIIKEVIAAGNANMIKVVSSSADNLGKATAAASDVLLKAEPIKDVVL